MKINEIINESLFEAPADFIRQAAKGSSAYSNTSQSAQSAKSSAMPRNTVNVPSDKNAKPTAYRDTTMRGYPTNQQSSSAQSGTSTQSKPSVKQRLQGTANKLKPGIKRFGKWVDPEKDPNEPLGALRSFALGMQHGNQMGGITALRKGLAAATGRLPSHLDPTKFSNDRFKEVIELLDKLPPAERAKLLNLNGMKQSLAQPPSAAQLPNKTPQSTTSIQPGKSKP